jgi:hypothetical protein
MKELREAEEAKNQKIAQERAVQGKFFLIFFLKYFFVLVCLIYNCSIFHFSFFPHFLAATEAEKKEAEKQRKAVETAAATKAAKQKEIDEKKRNELLQAKLKEMAKNIGTHASEKISEQLEEHFESSEDFVKRQLAQIVKERKKKEKVIEAGMCWSVKMAFWFR